jgi:putative Holliday junction resolvase
MATLTSGDFPVGTLDSTTIDLCLSLFPAGEAAHDFEAVRSCHDPVALQHQPELHHHQSQWTVSLSGVGFTDTLPSGFVVSTPNGLSGHGVCANSAALASICNNERRPGGSSAQRRLASADLTDLPRPLATYNRPVTSERTSTPGRTLGLDVGARRIGVAVSDPLGITAQGLETLHRENKRHDFAHLERVIRDYDVAEIVVGLPLRMSGAEGTQAEKIQAFAQELRKRFGLPVHLWDERLTSAEANRLLRSTDLSIEKRGKAVDRMAAVLILQGWMESRIR